MSRSRWCEGLLRGRSQGEWSVLEFDPLEGKGDIRPLYKRRPGCGRTFLDDHLSWPRQRLQELVGGLSGGVAYLWVAVSLLDGIAEASVGTWKWQLRHQLVKEVS